MPDDVIAPGAAAPGDGAAAPVNPTRAAPVAEAAAIAPAPAAPAAPAVDAVPAADHAPAPAADAPKPASDATKPAGDAKTGNEFKPSVLDAAAAPEKPAGDKPADKDAKPGEAKPAAAAKPGEAAKPAEPGKEGAPAEQAPAPIEYAFTYPEGISADSVNKERMGAFTGILNEGQVKPEVAQKFLDLHLTEMGEATKRIQGELAQKQWDVFNATQTAWREAEMSDPVLGGARHNTAMRTVMGLVDQYAGDAAHRSRLLDAFRITGIANNPDFLLFMHNAGVDLTREAEPHPAPPPRTPAPSREQRGLNRYRGTTPANGSAR
jgi:hypothetical protein